MPSALRSSVDTILTEWRRRASHGALAGVGWMLLACLLFSVLGIFIKAAKTYFSLSEMVFYRNLPTVLILGIFMPCRGHSLKTRCFVKQWQRATVGCISMTLSFFANITLPLGLAMALSYTNPIFLVLITWIIYRQRLQRGLTFCILMGLLGVIILLRPSGMGGGHWIGELAGLGAGLFAALAYMNIQTLSQEGEPEWRIVFYFGLISTLYALGAVLSLEDHFHTLTLHRLALILGLGLSGLLGQLCITHAFSQGQPTVTSVFSYSSPLFSALWGWLIFYEYPDAFSILGGLIVLASGVLTTWLKHPLPPSPNDPVPHGQQ